jgi:AcrR family transcriptional regulator
MSDRQADRPLAEELRDVARTRILRAAREVLAERGLDATVDDVADASGVSRRTVFRQFATRDRLIAEAIRDGIRSYSDHLPIAAVDGDVSGWLSDLLTAVHHLNARHGRIYWELAALGPRLTGEIAAAANERREARVRLVNEVCRTVWRASGGSGRPPRWLTDAFAVQLSAFTTRALAGDFDRTPDHVAASSGRVLLAAVASAVEDQRLRPR